MIDALITSRTDTKITCSVSKIIYDVSPDGQQFVFVDLLADSGRLNQINIILNWFEGLNERVLVP